MATIIPVINSDTDKQHKPAQAGDKLDPSLIMLDNNSENLLRSTTTGLSVRAEDAVSTALDNIIVVINGKLYAAHQVLPSQLSLETGNYLRLGNDGNIFVDGNDILSNEADNSLGISIVDGRIYFKEKNITDWLSSIDCQILSLDNTGKLKLCTQDLISNTDCQLIQVEDYKLKLCAADLINNTQENPIIVVDNKLDFDFTKIPPNDFFITATWFGTDVPNNKPVFSGIPGGYSKIEVIAFRSNELVEELTVRMQGSFIPQPTAINFTTVGQVEDLTDWQNMPCFFSLMNYTTQTATTVMFRLFN